MVTGQKNHQLEECTTQPDQLWNTVQITNDFAPLLPQQLHNTGNYLTTRATKKKLNPRNQLAKKQLLVPTSTEHNNSSNKTTNCR
jgi:hypothetical protein